MTADAGLDGTEKRVSCIVPAFNEGPRIGAVLDAVVPHPLIDEVVVIDDGSTDDTSVVAGGRAGVDLIRLPANGGKTRAVAVGLARATAPNILLVESDLQGLGPSDLTANIQPVLENRADMAISLRRNTPRLWRWIGIDYISGERMLQRSLIADRVAELEDLPRFGFAVWLNRICLASSARLVVVSWESVNSPMKCHKRGRLHGVLADLQMMSDLLHSAGPLCLVQHVIRSEWFF